MTTDNPSAVNEPAFWQDLYQRREDGWELGQPSPPLAEYLKRTPPPRGKVAVLGCGRGHDCRLLAQAGWEVWGFDFAAEAIREAQALAKLEELDIVFEQRDIFELVPKYRGFFDGVWEYTCFCAIDPSRRGEYVRLVREILKPEGWFLACFYPLREGTDGPPFPTSEAEIRRLFTPQFTFVEAWEPSASVERRKGVEWMVLARVKGHSPLTCQG
jgi:SAM-dependent methyltransferase